MRRHHPQHHMKWWRLIGWLYLVGLLGYGIFIILSNLPR